MRFIYIISILIGACFVSCENSEDLGQSGLLEPTIVNNEIDNYISTTFTEPYNMIIDYKWPSNEVDYNKVLLPVQIEQVKPFCELMNKLWIEPYKLHVNEMFLKKYLPKQIVLVGTPNYNSDGTVTEGVAEGGRKITIFGINNFDKQNSKLLIKQFATLHHEFAHILHQTKMYDPAFKEITTDRYTSTWYDFKNAEANEFGFITAYAMESPDEDFVEMAAHMLMLSEKDWTKTINSAPTEARELLKRKEAMVADYLLQKWNINVYELREIIQKRLNEI